MEPGHEDREYAHPAAGPHPRRPPSMEPGHEDREYPPRRAVPAAKSIVPQWSPVMKTGNTQLRAVGAGHGDQPSMEPGHEDREYQAGAARPNARRAASMEPGHEDREYRATGR